MMPHTTLINTLFLALVMCACGRLGDPGGGESNLPNRGIVPYTFDDYGENDPRVIQSGDILYRAPQAWVHDDQVILFIEGLDPADGTSAIYRAVSNDSGSLFGTPELALSVPTNLAWTEGRVGAPDITCSGTQCLMVVQTPGGFGLAEGTLQGEFQLRNDPVFHLGLSPELEVIESPSLIKVEQGYALYFEGRKTGDPVSRVYRATSDESLAFGAVDVVWEPELECLDITQDDSCWAVDGVTNPEVRVAINELGDTIYRMFYTGRAPGSAAIGFAASFDGLHWHGFVNNPVLQSDATLDHPSNILLDNQYMLFFLHHQTGTTHGIGRAVNSAGLASEFF